MPLRMIVAALALLLTAVAPAGAQTFPKFTGFVVDDANVLPPEIEADLTAKLDALQRDTKRQLVVATIADTQGYPLPDYGYQLGRRWGVGLKNADNGAILFLAPNNPAGQRGPRLEVGRGLEPILTDALSSQIITEQMMPRLMNGGDIAGAMTAGTDAVIAQLRAAPEEQQAKVDAAVREFDRTHQRRAERQRDGGFPWIVLLPIFIVAAFMIAGGLRGGGRGRRYRRGGDDGLLPIVLWSIADEVARSSRHSRSDWGGSSWGGGGGGWSGGGGGGGWGGGGFSGGGGGSFGGGGASGSW